MDDQNKNLILATALSLGVILIWFALFPPPEPEPRADAPQATDTTLTPPAGATDSVAQVPGTLPGSAETPATEPEDEAPRLAIETGRLTGSISLRGGRVDDLKLKDYRTSLEPEADIVTVLSPVGTDDAFYALYGWAAGGGLGADAVPGPNTTWTIAAGDTLSPGSPVTLGWDSPAGLRFERVMEIDEDFMFTVTQSVTNTGSGTATLAPYGMLARHGIPPDLRGFFILHEGGISMVDGTLTETNYDDFEPRSAAESADVAQNGWIGFTDHYWMTTLVGGENQAFTAQKSYNAANDIYQTVARFPTQSVAAGQTVTLTTQLYSGAKEWETIRAYQNQGVEGFIDSIDWGWFYFLTKPIFWLLHELNILIGNMGWAIIGLTFIIKLVLLPLAFKSYVSMAKMKELQPEMEALKERAGDDRQKLQQGMMEMYKKNKVNPAAGCLPILLQIPIFFSLYKVIFVTIELRHAPFFGPFTDLSAPDPTSVINLFGLLPFGAPDPASITSLIFIGILPILLGISMWLQQKLNPAPTDPTQQMIFAWMPWVFMFMLGGFASGLVVYWIANNVITFTQQYLIMRSQGYTPDLIGNIKGGFKKTPKTEKQVQTNAKKAAEDAKK
ncbi:MAG: membrane protein insertase YidC [Pseudomonadota bacterium]